MKNLTLLEKYKKLDSLKKGWERLRKNSNKEFEILYMSEIETISKELGLIAIEPSSNYMAIKAYCKEEYVLKVVAFKPFAISKEISSIIKVLTETLHKSYQDIYTDSFSKANEKRQYKIDWMSFLKMGRFKTVSEKE